MVSAEVELVKAEYIVVSLPAHGGAIGFVQVHEYNARAKEPLEAHYAPGQALEVVVKELASADTDGRLLLAPAKEEADAPAGEAVAARGKAQQGTVVAVTPLELHIKLDSGRYGRLHATQLPLLVPATPAATPARGRKAAAAAAAATAASPLAAYAPGAALAVKICGHAKGEPAPDGKSFFELELAGDDESGAEAKHGTKLEDLEAGGAVTGCVLQKRVALETSRCAWHVR